MDKKIKVSPSVIAADQCRLKEEIKKAEEAGADMWHIDVMDGHFVPNITIGPGVTKDIKKITNLPLEAHLMITNPEKYIKDFANAGADYIIFHIEAATDKASNIIKEIKSFGKKPGISLNPGTQISAIKDLLEDLDIVLVMSVNPGFYGQKFIADVVPKIKQLRSLFKGEIAVDGGINSETAAEAVRAGADILVAGSYIFKAEDIKGAIESLKNAK